MPGSVRAAVLAVDVVGEKERLDLLGLVVAVEEVAEAAGQERNHPADLGGRDLPEAPADPQRLEEAREAPRADVRRRLEEERLEVARQALELVVDADERARIADRELLELLDRLLAVRPPGHDGAVGKRHEERRIARDHLEAVRRELQVADDFGPQHAGDVRGRRRAAARRDLFGHARAAEDRPPLDDECRESAAREIGRGRQAVVPGADDDGVVRAPGRCLTVSHFHDLGFGNVAQVEFLPRYG